MYQNAYRTSIFTEPGSTDDEFMQTWTDRPDTYTSAVSFEEKIKKMQGILNDKRKALPYTRLLLTVSVISSTNNILGCSIHGRPLSIQSLG